MVLSSPSPSDHRKPCTLCQTPRDVLIRCQTTSCASGTWQFVCPGKCWTSVSGGVVDGDAAHPDYRYGGMWKNKHALVSAKKPKRKGKREGRGGARDDDGGDAGGGAGGQGGEDTGSGKEDVGLEEGGAVGVGGL